MISIAMRLEEWGEELKGLLNDLEGYSSMIVHNVESEHFVYIGRKVGWKKLEAPGAVIQRKLLDRYKRFYALVLALVRNGPEATLRDCEEVDKNVRRVVEQNDAQWNNDLKSYFDDARQAIATQVSLVQRAYVASDDQVLLVPDTNALLFNPSLETWRIPDAKALLIVLVPGVIGELDRHKAMHRVDTVREKAGRLIRQIKEYRRRGRLDEGVPLLAGYSTIMSWPTEPRVSETLPWLDEENADDRILASYIEVLRDHAATPTILVTGDGNLQNKADFARLPSIEPPDPQPV